MRALSRRRAIQSDGVSAYRYRAFTPRSCATRQVKPSQAMQSAALIAWSPLIAGRGRVVSLQRGSGQDGEVRAVLERGAVLWLPQNP
jgi:hypothetical protein